MFSDITKQNGNSVKSILYIIPFVGIIAFLLWRVKYGVANVDEAFYISIPYRLFQGDSMMVEEWGITQLSAFLMYPFVALYMLLFKSTEGILLAARILYIVISAITALYVFVRIKRINYIAGAVSSISILLYAPFAINALSYNSLCILLLVAMFATIATETKFRWSMCFCMGLLFACAVLCCPYLVIPLAVCSVLFVLYYVVFGRKKNSECEKSGALYFYKKLLVGIYLGSITLGLLFAWFVLRKAELSDMVASLPYILDDGRHSSTFLYKCFLYYASMKYTYRACVPVFLFEFIVLIAIKIIKSERIKNIGIVLLLALTTACELIVWYSLRSINYLFVPINILGILLFVIFWKNPVIRKTFAWIYVPGFIYSVCLHFSSNQDAFAIASAVSVSAVGSILITIYTVTDIVKWGKTDNVIGKLAVCAVCLTLVFSELELRYTSVFWDTDIKTQTEYVDYGPEKGLYASEKMKKDYSAMCENVEYIFEKYDSKNILFVTDSFQTVYYLFDGVNTAASSSWNVNNKERMNAYYSINPHKYPELIFALKSCELDFLDDLIKNYQVAEEDKDKIIYIRK